MATINGSLNSIESTTAASNYSGLGNAVVGTANRIYNSNGSLIFGAGNEITNSITDINASIITPGLFGGPSSSETRSVANTTTIGYDARASVEDGGALGKQVLALQEKAAKLEAALQMKSGVVTQAVQKGVLVDTIKQDKNGKPKIERVRVNHKR